MNITIKLMQYKRHITHTVLMQLFKSLSSSSEVGAALQQQRAFQEKVQNEFHHKGLKNMLVHK